MNLADASLGNTVTVERVGGQGSFHRRLLELGLLPDTNVTLVSVAPLGDPLELLVRGASLSIRRADAAVVEVRPTRKVTERPASAPDELLPLASDHWAGSTS